MMQQFRKTILHGESSSGSPSAAGEEEPSRQPDRRSYRTVQTIGPYTFAIPDPAPETKSRGLLHSLIMTRVVQPVGMSVFVVIWTVTSVVTRLFAPPVYRYLISQWLPPIMNRLDVRLEYQRQLLLQHVQGRVLDVGSGGGHYVRRLIALRQKQPHTKDDQSAKISHIVALEPLESLRKRVLEPLVANFHAAIASDNSNDNNAEGDDISSLPIMTLRGESLEEYAAVVQKEQDTKGDDALLFDWIILGNVLCEVPNVPQALAAVNALLKPGGYVYFCEHVASPPGAWNRTLQHVMLPWWKCISGGCHCTRDSLQALQQQRHWEMIAWQCQHICVAGEPLVMGICRKKGETEAV